MTANLTLQQRYRLIDLLEDGALKDKLELTAQEVTDCAIVNHISVTETAVTATTYQSPLQGSVPFINKTYSVTEVPATTKRIEGIEWNDFGHTYRADITVTAVERDELLTLVQGKLDAREHMAIHGELRNLINLAS